MKKAIIGLVIACAIVLALGSVWGIGSARAASNSTIKVTIGTITVKPGTQKMAPLASHGASAYGVYCNNPGYVQVYSSTAGEWCFAGFGTVYATIPGVYGVCGNTYTGSFTLSDGSVHGLPYNGNCALLPNVTLISLTIAPTVSPSALKKGVQ